MQLVTQLLPYGPMRMLDIGCGDGGLMRWAEETRGYTCTGIEMDADNVSIARGLGLNVTQCDIDGKTFPFDSGMFDVVFCGEFIEHIYDTDTLLEEARRVMKPEGVFFLTTPNLASWHNRITLALGYQPTFTEVSARANAGNIMAFEGTPPGHIRVMTYRSLMILLKRCGFNNVYTHGLGINTLTKRGIIRVLVTICNIVFSAPSVANELVVEARL